MLSITSNNDLYVLVDCNNFYASCERVFNPALNNMPVIVLSNNDGCVVARSEEAKAIGIGMGVPLFEIKHLVEKHNIQVFSSNYVLYGDMSSRVMNILRQFSPNIEFYSIDEAFLLLKGFGRFNIYEYAENICQTVKQCTGLPVSVGISTTKTLAKVANYLAKRVYKAGVFILLDNVDEYLKRVDVKEIWGIGHQRTKWLRSHYINTAYDLKNASDQMIKNKMTVTGVRTVWELRGIPCLTLEEVLPDKKAVTCSRMFGHSVDKIEQIEEALSAYLSRACVKIRKQNLLAGYLHVIIETSRFKGEYYNNSLGMYINPPSAYTPLLSNYSKLLLKNIFKEGYKYSRAGVVLTDLVKENAGQQHFIGPFYQGTRYQKLMQTIDKYNSGVNHDKIQFASEGLGKPWHMKQTRKSKRFTTRWDELLEIF